LGVEISRAHLVFCLKIEGRGEIKEKNRKGGLPEALRSPGEWKPSRQREASFGIR